MSRRAVLRKVMWVAGGALAALVLLICAFAALIQTDFGKRSLASNLSRLLSNAPERRVVIEGLSGVIPFRMRLQHLELADSQGVWLTAQDLLLHWSPYGLLRGELSIDEISSRSVDIQRKPLSKEDDHKPFDGFSLPGKLPVSIKHLAVERLSLEKPFLDAAGVFALEGRMEEAAGAASGRTAYLGARRLDEGPETRLDLAATLLQPARTLQLKGELAEAPGGWIASVLGVKGNAPLELTIAGDGPLDAWKGTIDGSAGSLGAIHTGVGLAIEKEIRLTLDGAYEAASASLPPKLEPLLADALHFSLAARFAPSRFVAVERGNIWTDGYQLRMAGKMDLASKGISADWNLGVADLSFLEPLVESPISGDLAFEGTISGTPAQLHADVGLHASELAVKGARVKSFETTIHVEPLTDSAPAYSGARISGTGKLAGLETPDAKQLPENNLQWSLDASVPKSGEISLDSLRIEGEKIALNLSGRFDRQTLAANADALLEVKDLGFLAASAGNGLTGGEGSLKVHITGDGRTRSGSGRIEGRLSHVKGPSPALAALLSPELKFGGDVLLEAGSKVDVPSFTVESRAFKLTSQLAADISEKKLAGGWQLSAPDLSPFGTALNKHVAGSIASEGHIQGDFANLQCTASLKGTSLVLDKRKFQQIVSKLQADGLPHKPRGTFQLEVLEGGRKLDASSDFALEGEQLKLSSIALDVPGGGIKGNLAVGTKTPSLQGVLEGKFKDLSGLGGILGEPLDGSAELHAQLSQDKGSQNVHITLKGRALAARFGKIKEISLSAQLADVLRAPRGNVDASLQEFQGPKMVLHTVSLKASGDGKGASFEGVLKGRSTEDFDLKTRGSLSRSGASEAVQISALDGRFGPYPVRLLTPARIGWAPDGLAVDGIALGFGKGRLEGSARINRKSASIRADFDQVPLAASKSFGGPQLLGSAAGHLLLQGASSRPSVNVDIKLSGLRSPAPSLRDMPASSVALSANLEGGHAKTTIEVAGVTEKPARLSLAAPVELSLMPFSFALPPQGAIEGRFDAEADLKRLASIFPQEDHVVTGQLAAHFDIRGTVGSPDISGSASVGNGSYQNLAYGTLLKNIVLQVGARGRKIEIQSLRASDGEQGGVEMSGWVDVDSAKKFPMRLDATISRATLVRRDDATAAASGAISLSGSLAAMTLSGKLDIDSAEITLPKRLPAQVVKMDVIEINAPAGRSAKPKPAQHSAASDSPFVFKMDLTVSSTGRMFVRGNGLNSEWSGELKISGTGQATSITGALKPVRGYFDFLDKRFKLVDGAIYFYGESPPTPYMQLTAEASAKDITARIVLSGNASSPKVEFQSDPPLPSDEVIARVLFNKGMTKLSPVQALKLANALKALSGHGDTLDILGDARKFLGLDQLDFRESDLGTKSKTSTSGSSDTNMAVGAGKYLTDDVYVDVEKGVGDNTGKVRVEVDITPQISVESNVGVNSGSGLGINWKYDY